MNKDDKKLNSIIDEYKMSMGGSFFSKVQLDEDDKESEQILIDDLIENHLFDAQKLLLAYDELGAGKKRELFYRVVISFINQKIKQR